MFLRTQKNGDRVYLVIAQNQRVDGKVKQTVLHRLGRLDQIQQSGGVDSLLLSMQRFSDKLAVLGAHDNGQSIITNTYRIGPSLIFQRLWSDLGVDKVLASLLRNRKFEFSVERAVFLTVLHRMFAPGSDRAADKWRRNYLIEGADDLNLHHLYRAMAWLGEQALEQQDAAGDDQQKRAIKDIIEESLFEARRDLFTSLDMVFFDTTSIYFEGAGGQTIGRRGHSKDHRPDLKQMVVGVVLDDQGNPVCSQMWPGNVTDVKSLLPIVKRLQDGFRIRRICIVADRGMVSAANIKEIEAQNWKYILGVRMRNSKQARELVLADQGEYQEVYRKIDNGKGPSPLKVKEATVDGRRYVICLNQDQATKDKHDREAIVASLKDSLNGGDKSLIGNKGYRKFVKTSGERFTLDENKIKQEEQYDGKWVLTTNTELSAASMAIKYKQLLMVEDVFRTMKSVFDTRPIYHKRDETITGHVFCSFLALVMRKELEDRLKDKGLKLEWADVIRDLDSLQETAMTVADKQYVLRSEIKGTTGNVFQACGVAIPPVLRQC